MSEQTDRLLATVERLTAENATMRNLLSAIERHAFQQKVWGGMDGYILHPMSPRNQQAIRDILTKWSESECDKALDRALAADTVPPESAQKPTETGL